VSRELVSRDANLLVNLTNDAWFGDTVEPRQHMALSTLRAVENRRDLVRAVNTGVSAVVEASGRVAVSTETWQEVVIVHDVRLLEGRTVYQIVGDWPAWLGILVLVLAALWARIRGMPRGRGKKRTRSPVGTGGGT